MQSTTVRTDDEGRGFVAVVNRVAKAEAMLTL
jgi:hypothetical protein